MPGAEGFTSPVVLVTERLADAPPHPTRTEAATAHTTADTADGERRFAPPQRAPSSPARAGVTSTDPA
jgi:hypothetical protein